MPARARDSRRGLDTPCLVVDLDVAAANARRMAEGAAARGVALRPHVKTHKSVRLARAAARCRRGRRSPSARIGEAEAMVDGGIDDVFIGYPVWADGPKAARLRALHERSSLTVGVDSAEAAALLAARGRTGRRRGRCGCSSRWTPAPAGAASRAPRRRWPSRGAPATSGLEVIGVFTHGGHGYRAPGAGPSAAADEVADPRRRRRRAPRRRVRRSSGSRPARRPTGVHAAAGQVNEIRPGTVPPRRPPAVRPRRDPGRGHRARRRRRRWSRSPSTARSSSTPARRR